MRSRCSARRTRPKLQASLGSPAHLECLDLLAALAVDPLEHGFAHFARADALGQLTEGVAAEAEARRGLAAIAGERGRAADELQVDLSAALANGLFIQDRPVAGADAVRAVEPRMLALGDRHREIEHYANLGVLLDAGNRHVEAQAALRHVISLTRAEGDAASELVVLSNLGSSLHDVGRVAAALVPLREALALEERFPELRTGAVFVQVQLGNMHRALGDYAEALRWLTAGMAILEAYVPRVVAAAHNALARLWLDMGQPARAGQALQQALSIPSGPPLFRALGHLLAARIAMAQGQRGAAAEALAAADAHIIDSTRYGVRAQAALLAAQLEDPDAAYARALGVAHEAGRLHMMGVRIDALVCAACRVGRGAALGGGEPCPRGARPVARACPRQSLCRRALAGRARQRRRRRGVERDPRRCGRLDSRDGGAPARRIPRFLLDRNPLNRSLLTRARSERSRSEGAGDRP